MVKKVSGGFAIILIVIFLVWNANQIFALPIDGGLGATNRVTKTNLVYGVQGHINWKPAPSITYMSLGIRTDSAQAPDYSYVQWGWFQPPGIGQYVDGLIRTKGIGHQDEFWVQNLYVPLQTPFRNDHYAVIFDPNTQQFTAYFNGMPKQRFSVFGFEAADIFFGGVGYGMGGRVNEPVEFTNLTWVRRRTDGVLVGRQWPNNVADIRHTPATCTYITKNSFSCR